MWGSLRCGGAHPRVRGEYSGLKRRNLSLKGSPPRSRGIHPLRALRLARHRLTPAFAGNTAALEDREALAAAHPRVRGEYTEAMYHVGYHLGSPPRSRGIPTTWPGSSTGARAHPRVRGEYRVVRRGGGRRVVVGLTPAFAGNTV